MAEEKDNDNTDLVRPDNRNLTPRSASLIRRGLKRIDEESTEISIVEHSALAGCVGTLDENTYYQARLYFETALEQFTGNKDVVNWAVIALLKKLVDDYGFPSQEIQEMKPYVVRFIAEYFGEAKSGLAYQLRKAITWQFIEAYLAKQLKPRQG